MSSWTGIDWINCGSRLSEQDPWLAQRTMAHGICKDSDKFAAYFNLGIALHLQKRPEAAIRAYQTSLNLAKSPNQSILSNLAHDLLLTGAFEEGWKVYEMRFKSKQNEFFEKRLGSPWQGPIQGESLPTNLILICEQGFGDTFQFSRFALTMQEMGVNISFFCQRELVKLIQEGTGIKYISNLLTSDQLEGKPSWCPLLSMPNRLGVDATNIPSQFPYINANKQRTLQWREYLKRKQNHLLIGLHWQGNPQYELPIYARGRSMSFKNWLGLSGIQGVEFVSLQKGVGQGQLELNKGLNFVEGQEIVNRSLDFRDTAAVIAQCDLIISTDNCIVHLAGAMGVPTWVALKWIAEWRWGLEDCNSNWYPSMKLFRQPSSGDWKSVVKNMRKALISEFNLKN